MARRSGICFAIHKHAGLVQRPANCPECQVSLGTRLDTNGSNNIDANARMTREEERELHRRVDRLQTEVALLRAVAGTMLSIIRQLGFQHVADAVVGGLTDAAASVPARNEADWDRFVAYIRSQGSAVSVKKLSAEPIGARRRTGSPDGMTSG